MSQLDNLFKILVLIIIVIIALDHHTSHADATQSHTTASRRQIFNATAHHPHHHYYKQITRNELFPSNEETQRTTILRFLLPATLSFLAAAISSAGGIGGGGLFIPILTITAGFDLKKASTFSAFMVTGGSIANVACHTMARLRSKTKPVIDYDIALLSEPFMLLGVSLGVVLNVIFPEWLITLFFVGFIALCTFKTCKNGVVFWKMESEDISVRRESGCGGGGCEGTETPLLIEVGEEGRKGIPWVKLGTLAVIWFAFFVLNLLRGNRYGEGIIKIESCGTAYWLISSLQIPLAIVFTALIIMHRQMTTKPETTTRQEDGVCEIISSQHKLTTNKIIFPMMALLAGILGGVFGIGGGMFISPLLLQIGIDPKVTAGTCSFMVLFSSTMSAVQYLLLGMSDINGALIYAAICLFASLLGLTLVQRAITKHGRSSVIVFSVGTVMAFSTVLMTSYGALDVWRDYKSGKSMGFQKPC